MNTEIIMIASGKGGVGKSTVCTMLGAALASLNKKVLLIEMDNGLRGLDIMNGVHNEAVFDLHDLLDGSVSPEKAILPSRLQDNLFVLAGSLITSFVPTADKLNQLFQQLDGQYDFIFLDCPAGIGSLFEITVSVCNLALLVVTPDFLTVRMAQAASGLLGKLPAKLIINKIPTKFRPTPVIPDLDAVIDMVGIPLIGVIPEDFILSELVCTDLDASFSGNNLLKSKIAFLNIAGRLTGEYIPLSMM